MQANVQKISQSSSSAGVGVVELVDGYNKEIYQAQHKEEENMLVAGEEHAQPIAITNGAPGSGLHGPEAPGIHSLKRKSSQLKASTLPQQHPGLSYSCPPASFLSSGPKEAEPNGELKSDMGRSISAMFKGALFKSSLFNSSSASNSYNNTSSTYSCASASLSASSSAHSFKGSTPAATRSKPMDLDGSTDPGLTESSPPTPMSSSPSKVTLNRPPTKDSRFSLKSMFQNLQSPSFISAAAPSQQPPSTSPFAVYAHASAPLPSQPPSNSSRINVDKVQPGGQKSMGSSDAADAEIRMAVDRRAAPFTNHVGASSTMLVVTRDLPARMSRPMWSLNDYLVLEKMYTGYASNVYKAKCKHSGVLVCLKSYTLGNLCELNRFQIFREVKLHSSLSHEHVIKLYGAFKQNDQVVLVQEYANSGDLFTLLHRYGGRLSERNAVELVLQPFLLAINYLHAHGIAHRDIKPENILYTSDMRLKLCDFGLAINMREEKAVTRAGTLEYMAPEVLDCPFKNKPEENKGNRMLHYSYHVDTWAIGVLTYELLVGLPPFNDKQRNAVEDKIRLAPPRFPAKMSELCRDFITMALEKNPLERPTVMELLTHPWIKMHKRSSSIQLLSGFNRQGSGTFTHSTSQIMNSPILEDREHPVRDGQPPLQPPANTAVMQPQVQQPTQSVFAQQQHLAVPDPQLPATAPKGIYKPPNGGMQATLFSSSYTADALPLTAFPGMVPAVHNKSGAAAKAAMFAPSLDKHMAQHEQHEQVLAELTPGFDAKCHPVAHPSDSPGPHSTCFAFTDSSSSLPSGSYPAKTILINQPTSSLTKAIHMQTPSCASSSPPCAEV